MKQLTNHEKIIKILLDWRKEDEINNECNSINQNNS